MKVLHTFNGAIVRRVIDRSHAQVPEHSHDWPVLSIFVLGGYWNRTDAGERYVDGHSAVLYRAGCAHRNTASAVGFEQIEIEFDPAWLGRSTLPDGPVWRSSGGQAAASCHTLARYCGGPVTEDGLRAAVAALLRGTDRRETHSPPWIDVVSRRLREDTSLRVLCLAREVGRHPSWLGSAYRCATGEGLLEAAARFRVECASRLLRETDQAYASVASEAGFCDQSHMSRTFQRMLGRLPSAVRQDRDCLRQGLPMASSKAALSVSRVARAATYVT
jgi:AraC-like DNA-binding protein